MSLGTRLGDETGHQMGGGQDAGLLHTRDRVRGAELRREARGDASGMDAETGFEGQWAGTEG